MPPPRPGQKMEEAGVEIITDVDKTALHGRHEAPVYEKHAADIWVPGLSGFRPSNNRFYLI
jgi:hypothetical protein